MMTLVFGTIDESKNNTTILATNLIDHTAFGQSILKIMLLGIINYRGSWV